MAVLKQGPLGTISGSLGSVCIATTKGGTVIRSRKQQQANSSPAQDKAHLQLSFFSTLWQTPMMETYRDAWNNYARNHPVPDRFGTPRLRSGYVTWLSFLPLHKTFYPANILLMPPVTSNYDNIITFEASLTTAPSFVTTTSGPFTIFQTYEQVQIARFQQDRDKPLRPVWQNMPYPTILKTFNSEDWFSFLKTPEPPILGETWQCRLRWWNATREPTPWFYASATATT